MTDLSPSTLMLTIAKLRRMQPRNLDVLLICEALERRIQMDSMIRAVESRPAPNTLPVSPVRAGRAKPAAKEGFDKTAYQREYMRTRRAAAKAKGMAKASARS